MQDPWFAPKRVGIGLRPTNWKGWLTVVALMAAVVVLVLAVPPATRPLEFWIGVAVALIAFGAVVWSKRERQPPE
jgi:hypothetical protein